MSVYDIYFASPFFCNSERDFNSRMIAALESRGLKVFSPIRDGIVAKDEFVGSNNWKEVASRVWDCDIRAIESSKLIFAVIDGRSIDEGVCVEIGLAAGMKKTIVAFNSDDRKKFPWGHNPMVIHPIVAIYSDVETAAAEAARIVVAL